MSDKRITFEVDKNGEPIMLTRQQALDNDVKAAIERVVAALVTIRNLDAESPYAYPTIASGDLTVLAYDAEQDALAIRTTVSELEADLERAREAVDMHVAAHRHDHAELEQARKDFAVERGLVEKFDLESERYRAKFKLLEDGLRRAMTCQHHDVVEDCAHGQFGFDCARKDCHQLHAENVLAALHSEDSTEESSSNHSAAPSKGV